MKTIDVCLSPELIHLHDVKGKIVVIIDILRATSCMTAGLATGVKSIKAVATLDECKALGQQGYVTAAERDGSKVEGFDMGNSPFSYQEPHLKGKSVAVTTTNGTQALVKSLDAAEILVGSFLNISSIIKYIKSQDKDVILHCAGWKGKMNLEDTLFAGAVVEEVKGEFTHKEDSVLVALQLYHAGRNNMLGYLSNSSHVNRLKGLGISKDIEYCLTRDVFDVLPKLVNGELVAV